MPSADPWAAGFTTSGNPSRSSIAGSASAAPNSLKATSLKAKNSGVGRFRPVSRCLVSTLSMHRMQARTPEPV